MYKKGTYATKTADPTNFGTISLLPIASKIYENVIEDQTMEYLTDNTLIISIWFSREPSTQTSLSYLTNKILTDFDSGLLTGIILINLQNAFANINHMTFYFYKVFKSLTQ